MARKQEDFVVSSPGRDHGKVFVLHEMPPRQADKWATRAIMIAMTHGIKLDFTPDMGMAGIAIAGLQTLLQGATFEEVEPLLDEVMPFIEMRPDPSGHPDIVRKLTPDDIEEIRTFIELRTAYVKMVLRPTTAGEQ